jgi:hypothetical protein
LMVALFCRQSISARAFLLYHSALEAPCVSGSWRCSFLTQSRGLVVED